MSLVERLHLPLHPTSPEQIIPHLRYATTADIVDEGRGHKVPYAAILRATEVEVSRQNQRVNVGIFVVHHELRSREPRDRVVIQSGTVLELDRSTQPLDAKNSAYYLSFGGDNYPFSAPTTEGYMADKEIAAIGLCSLLGHPIRRQQRP